MTMTRTLGLPLKCPGCPPIRYFGILKGIYDRSYVPTSFVKISKNDRCPNCNKHLVSAREI